ncbi:unnamed protein product [Diamesa hyperborea]
MSYNRGNSGNRRNYKSNNNNQQIKKVEIDENNPILKSFQLYSSELLDKQDRYERITKHSRDITIESKRIIFLLHTVDARKDNKTAVLQDAKSRIDKICDTQFAAIAQELVDLDQYQYARAFSAGLQEFIEAYSFYEYLAEEPFSDWEKIEERFVFSISDKEQSSAEIPEENIEPIVLDEKELILKNCTLRVVPLEFMLGLADLTGEVMRNSINSLGSGDIDNCFKTCKFLQNIYSKYLSLNNVPNRNRDMNQKMFTMRASTIKSEKVCYNLMVRGKEGAKMSPLDSGHNDYEENLDEGFF